MSMPKNDLRRMYFRYFGQCIFSAVTRFFTDSIFTQKRESCKIRKKIPAGSEAGTEERENA